MILKLEIIIIVDKVILDIAKVSLLATVVLPF